MCVFLITSSEFSTKIILCVFFKALHVSGTFFQFVLFWQMCTSFLVRQIDWGHSNLIWYLKQWGTNFLDFISWDENVNYDFAWLHWSLSSSCLVIWGKYLLIKIQISILHFWNFFISPLYVRNKNFLNMLQIP